MYGFSRSRRLLTKRDYNHVFKQAKKIVTREFVILYVNNSCGYSRLGLALSKKSISKAHDRNKVRRVLRETFRTNQQLPSVDVVVLARQAVKNIQPSTLFHSVSKLWDKLVLDCEQ